MQIQEIIAKIHVVMQTFHDPKNVMNGASTERKG